ncbi:MAG: hypothetical protein IPH49_08910 [Ignavibacteria bacterium]|nr:hypothetical protein [Ignavibacteria bacterium]
MKRIFASAFLTLTVSVLIGSCGLTESDPADPNDPVGGNTELEDTKPGARHSAYPDLGDWLPYDMVPRDSIIIKSRNNGVVVVDFNVTFDTAFTLRLDTMLGTTILPDNAKKSLIDTYLAQYGATLDTTNKDRMIIHAEPKFRVTSEGIQDFVASKEMNPNPSRSSNTT